MALGDVKYIVARPFLSHLGSHAPGELAPAEASGWLYLDAFISSGMLTPYVSEKGYDNLPPHVYSAVVTRQEALGLIQKGDAPVAMDWEPAEILLEAQQVRDDEAAFRETEEAKLHKRAAKEHEEKLAYQADAHPVEVRGKVATVDAKAEEAAAAASDEDEDKYANMTKEQLVTEIETRNKKYGDDSDRSMNITGTKSELGQRLKDDDAK